MQSAEAKFNKNSLHLALRRYSSAVSDMEQTILLPSLLRDVPSDRVWDSEEVEESCCGDLYGNYLMLKTIRNAVESGLFHLGEQEPETQPELSDSRPDADPEALFRFHLSGLFSVMSDLTKRSQSLTEKYMDIIGVTN
ncbi:mid1-interacting protein 1-B-like [Limanda limanda]|uniref:mid1-interacting protein 1-B-like n=1 Tax=Limanda limanda TaxID=27771 RepID=UPI0029C95754|nr:mid1-interacting protein 1-B-like [Limanda limanda]